MLDNSLKGHSRDQQIVGLLKFADFHESFDAGSIPPFTRHGGIRRLSVAFIGGSGSRSGGGKGRWGGMMGYGNREEGEVLE